jgi:hypothetical protein
VPRKPPANTVVPHDVPPELPLVLARERYDEELVRELYRRENAALRKLLDLAAGLPLNRQTKESLIRHVYEFRYCMHELRAAFMAELLRQCKQAVEQGQEAVEGLLCLHSEVENQRRGPRLRHERVLRRHVEIDKAVEAGITDDEELFKFMQDYHPELIRKGKKDFISPQQMMRLYRERRKS